MRRRWALAVVTVAVLGVALGALVVSAPGENPDESIETPDFAFEYPKEWRVLPNPYVRLRATAAGADQPEHRGGQR